MRKIIYLPQNEHLPALCGQGRHRFSEEAQLLLAQERPFRIGLRISDVDPLYIGDSVYWHDISAPRQINRAFFQNPYCERLQRINLPQPGMGDKARKRLMHEI